MGLLEYLRATYAHDPERGLVRVVKGGRSSTVGAVLGGRVRQPGRVYVVLNEFSGKKKYLLHRLVWLHAHGTEPEEIDHINGDPSDNRLVNLRPASHGENMQNMRRARADSTSGLIGAMPHQGTWRSDIQVAGKKHYLGVFKTPEAAHAAYVQAKRALHPYGTL